MITYGPGGFEPCPGGVGCIHKHTHGKDCVEEHLEADLKCGGFKTEEGMPIAVKDQAGKDTGKFEECGHLKSCVIQYPCQGNNIMYISEDPKENE